MFKHILLATDGSEFAQIAVDQGLELAHRLNARVTAVTATELWLRMDAFPTPSAIRRYDEAAAERARAILDPVLKAARARGLICEVVHVKDAGPAEAILKASLEHGCDLIVVASHGYGPVQRFLLGSVANEVVTASPVPVMLVKRPSQSAPSALPTGSTETKVKAPACT